MAKTPEIPVQKEPEAAPDVEAPKPPTVAEIAAPKPPGEMPKNIPKIELPKAEDVRYIGQPPPNEVYKGSYRQLSTGHLFALAVAKPQDVENGKTHFLKNNVYSWNGTALEFREQFEKE